MYGPLQLNCLNKFYRSVNCFNGESIQTNPLIQNTLHLLICTNEENYEEIQRAKNVSRINNNPCLDTVFEGHAGQGSSTEELIINIPTNKVSRKPPTYAKQLFPYIGRYHQPLTNKLPSRLLL